MSEKRQTELEGFERPSIPEIDAAVRAVVDATDAVQVAKLKLQAAKERVDFLLYENELTSYPWVDGEAELKVEVNEKRDLRFKWVARPKVEEESDGE